jgi:hypothetical protein
MRRSKKNLRERCMVSECTRPAFSRGRCQRHYLSFLAERKVFVGVRPAALQKPDTPKRESYSYAGDEEALYEIYGEEGKCQTT